jgi:capsule polysaccharide export protein KpsE/RkpR
MKTIYRTLSLIGLLLLFLSSAINAQTPLQEMQSMQTSLNNEITLLNAQIQAIQEQVAINNEIIAAGKPENDIAQLQIEVQENQNFIVDLQALVALKQADLAALEGKMESYTEQQNSSDRQWIQQHAAAPANQVIGPQYTPAGTPVQNIPNPNVKEDPNAPSISVQ